MPAKTIEEQLVKYLADAHSIEEQALSQLRDAPKIAGDPRLEQIFRDHLAETEGHERLVRERLEAHGAEPSRFKKGVMAAGGKGFVAFAKTQPDTPGKLVTHAYSYEHLELASYELLLRVAERAGDAETAEVARTIREQERAMGDRLAGAFDIAVDASLRDLSPDDLREQLARYLGDAHALEEQATALLQGGIKLVEDPELSRLFEQHLAETRHHSELVEQRLDALDSGPSKLKDIALKAAGLSWGGFFKAHPDTPGKLVAFAFAFEHLEIGGYEQLRRVAERAGEEAAVQMAETILADERAAAAKLSGAFNHAAELALQEQGVA
jgi:ferritin-like metal-binding protein YciE